MIPRIMPEPDGSDSSKQLIREYIGNAHTDKSIVLTRFDGQLMRRAEIMAVMDKLDTEKKTIEQKQKLFMGDAEVAENGSSRVSWKNSSSTRLDTKALNAEQPDIFERYSKSI